MEVAGTGSGSLLQQQRAVVRAIVINVTLDRSRRRLAAHELTIVRDFENENVKKIPLASYPATHATHSRVSDDKRRLSDGFARW